MSFGALGTNAKMALGRGFTTAGSATCTGEGGMLPEERDASKRLIYQMTPSRYGLDLEHLRRADAIEIALGQGAKPGTGGLLLGMKVSEKVARMRTLPVGVDQRACVRHPDFLGADDLQVKIEELREATDYQVPIILKLAACRVEFDVKIAAKTGCDAIVLDGTEGATAAAPEYQLDNCGIPLVPAIPAARRAIEDLGMSGKITLIVSGGIRNGSDVAKALALGADCVAIGTSALIALGCNERRYHDDYAKLGTAPGACHHCHTGRCPVGITTQDPGARAAARPRRGGAPRRELPARDHDGAHGHREVRRQARRAQPRAGGSQGDVARGLGVHGRPAGGRRMGRRPAALRRRMNMRDSQDASRRAAELVAQHDVHTVECAFPDTWGALRGKRIPASQFANVAARASRSRTRRSSGTCSATSSRSTSRTWTRAIRT